MTKYQFKTEQMIIKTPSINCTSIIECHTTSQTSQHKCNQTRENWWQIFVSLHSQ